ncbi:Rab GTPase [Tieghemostelium lacteum]|uniref:Rab GTPase n=1 Tax=Tieghemostelium lacteum TaxID=361077 RepID=A0A151Z4A6_TIELA|nr:Rab GTPase [Tieghemostelium lacteum]|eukprot:KYQ88747.1 Rab GTPase [Tieghemostelium lacteum]
MQNNNNRISNKKDNIYKLIIRGPWKSGKTSLKCSYIQGSFPIPTVYFGIDFSEREYNNGILKDCKSITIRFWDFQSAERFQITSRAFYLMSDAVILLFDLSNYSSYKESKKMYSELDALFDSNFKPLFYFVGNKSDLPQDSNIKDDEVLSFAQSKNMKYFKVSSKLRTGFEQFDQIAFDLQSRSISESTLPPSIVLPTDQNSNNNRYNGYC